MGGKPAQWHKMEPKKKKVQEKQGKQGKQGKRKKKKKPGVLSAHRPARQHEGPRVARRGGVQQAQPTRTQGCVRVGAAQNSRARIEQPTEAEAETDGDSAILRGGHTHTATPRPSRPIAAAQTGSWRLSPACRRSRQKVSL